tara:strand:- start:2629 stop:2856 length:228 start_codon:yes stop_codon:yes gene_type:complete
MQPNDIYTDEQHGIFEYMFIYIYIEEGIIYIYIIEIYYVHLVRDIKYTEWVCTFIQVDKYFVAEMEAEWKTSTLS